MLENTVKYQNLSQFRVPAESRGRPTWYVQIWMIVSATLFRWSPRIFWGWRRLLLRSFGAKIGANVLIRPSCSIYYPWKVTIGDNSWIGDDSTLYSLANIAIGANVAIAHGVYLCAGSHDISSLTFDQTSAPIRIEDEVWLANQVFVAPGVVIGKGCVVGTRSLVVSDLPSGMVCYGSPAKSVRSRKTPADE